MKVFLIFLLGFNICLATEKINVLIVDGFNNHDWERTTSELQNILKQDKRIKASISTVPAIDSDAWQNWNPDFTKYDVVIQNTNDIKKGGKWTESAQRGLEIFLSNGGGMVCFHSANNAFPEWQEYNKMIGLGWRKKDFGKSIHIVDGNTVEIPAREGQSTGHGKRNDTLVTRLNDHPIHSGLPESWKAADLETYRYARGPAENLTVISYALEEKTGLNFPVEWVVNYGKGRVYNSTYGHYWNNQKELPPGMRCTAFRTILLRSVYWAAGKEISFDLPEDFPTQNQISLTNTESQGYTSIFNGENWDGWYLKIRTGDEQLAQKVFAINDKKEIHIFNEEFPDEYELNTGENKTHGLFYTEKEYSKYHLKFQYKWGKRLANNFGQWQYDSGVYYHVTNDQVWPTGIEYQIRYNHLTDKNHTGDLIRPKGVTYKWYAVESGAHYLHPNNGGVLEPKKHWYHHAKPTNNHNALNDQWNTCEIIAMGDDYSIHILNGEIVNMIFSPSPSKGIIGFQSETAEILFRNITIKEFETSKPAEHFLKQYKR